MLRSWHKCFVACLVHLLFDMPHSCVIIFMTWAILMCYMPHSCVWRDSFVCVTWLIHMCDMPRSYVWHKAVICVPRIVHMCHVTRSYVCHASLITQCNTLQHTATHCNTLQHTVTHCNTPQHTATHRNTPQHTAARCNTLQHTATHCNTLQHTATHCNTPQVLLYYDTPPWPTNCYSFAYVIFLYFFQSFLFKHISKCGTSFWPSCARAQHLHMHTCAHNQTHNKHTHTREIVFKRAGV